MLLELFTLSPIGRSLIVGLLALAASSGCDRQSAVPVQANDTAATSGEVQPADASATGDDAAAAAAAVKPDFSHRGAAPPDAAFIDPAGKPMTLAALKGRPVLVNLWATWCAPCVAELPTLAALAKREGTSLTVLTVNQDLDAAKAAPFLAKRGVALPAYADPELKLSVAYAANLPATVLYGADGKERWRVIGGMDWAGADAAKLIALGYD